MNHEYIEHCISLGIPAEFAVLMEAETAQRYGHFSGGFSREDNASDQLNESFLWAESTQGSDFWMMFDDALLNGSRHGDCK